jgi:hypothetical protein
MTYVEFLIKELELNVNSAEFEEAIKQGDFMEMFEGSFYKDYLEFIGR